MAAASPQSWLTNASRPAGSAETAPADNIMIAPRSIVNRRSSMELLSEGRRIAAGPFDPFKPIN
jgi:hypothetical protein